MGKSSSRHYSARTLKILWGRAAGRCAVPTCRIELLVDATDYDPIVPIGDIAHVEASSDYGPRANVSRAKKERDDYDNLILLCPTCHRRLDGQKNTNTVESIKQLRADHEAWVRNSLPERGKSTTGWNVILLQGEHKFDLEPAINALLPDFPSGDPLVIKADPGKDSWDEINTKVIEEVRAILNAGDPFNFRLAIFPLAPVSACIAVGYYLTHRPRVRLFKFYTDDHSWTWPEDIPPQNEIKVSGFPEEVIESIGEIAMCFHLSASITDEVVAEVGQSFLGVIHIKVPSPNTGWLRHSEQLKQLAQVAREVFETGQSRFPLALKWHIFFAGPAPGCVIVGQQIYPSMCPPIQLYEYQRGRKPAYSPSILLGENAE